MASEQKRRKLQEPSCHSDAGRQQRFCWKMNGSAVGLLLRMDVGRLAIIEGIKEMMRGAVAAILVQINWLQILLDLDGTTSLSSENGNQSCPRTKGCFKCCHPLMQ